MQTALTKPSYEDRCNEAIAAAAGAPDAAPMADQQAWDMFAASALGGAAANPSSGANSPRDLAHWAASLADSMMIQRRQRRQSC